MKMYINEAKETSAYNSSIAMAWYRQGYNVRVETYDGARHLKSVIVHGAAQPKKKDKNREHCKSIVNELERYSNGFMYKCPDCGELLEINPSTVGDKYRCSTCETTNDIDDFEQLSLWDYFTDNILDTEYIIGSDKRLRAVRILVAWGGPNIWIDTHTGQVELYWWNESAKYPLDADTIDEINELFEELFNC